MQSIPNNVYLHKDRPSLHALSANLLIEILHGDLRNVTPDFIIDRSDAGERQCRALYNVYGQYLNPL
jgi:hypothetical protein